MNNITAKSRYYDKTRRQLRSGALCFILLMVVAASACLIPAQSSDVASADTTGIYVVSDGTCEIGTYDRLEAAVTAINSAGGIVFTITVYNDDPNVTEFTVDAGKNVTLISAAKNVFELTTASGLHGSVEGSLTLENIILDGNGTAGGIRVYPYAVFTMSGGATIQNCYAEEEGGGVFNTGTFSMYGGATIQDCHANHGAGVYNTGTFSMYGGRIDQNSAYICGGGIYSISSSAINMSGDAVVSNNFAYENGGGIHITSYSALNMSGNAAVTGNRVNYFGGGIYNSFSSVFDMSDNAVVSGNSAAISGGGVYNGGAGTFTMSDNAVISGNSATKYGGGVYNTGGAFTMSGNAVISGNAAANGGGVTNQNITFNMSGDAAISGNSATNGGGVYNFNGTFNMDGNAMVSNNDATACGGGVYNQFLFTIGTYGAGDVYGNNLTRGLNFPIINMSGNAAICNNTVTAALSYGGGVYNTTGSILNMDDSAAIYGNTVISEKTVNARGGGVFNSGDSGFLPTAINMRGGEIRGNSAVEGGGVYNGNTFNMYGGSVGGNTADYGGGVYNTGTLNITGGMIVGNTANKSDSRGSGGGIYTTDFAGLSVADGVVFSGNTAPMPRMIDIASNADINGKGTPDLNVYVNKIGAVRLDTMMDRGQNAPAYNNYDINYPGDTFIVYVDIDPNGAGSVTVTESGSGTVYGTLTADGYVYVPSTVTSITISAASASGYEFKQFIIDGTPTGSGDLITVPMSGDISVVAKFASGTTPPEEPPPVTPPVTPPGSKDYIITANADDGSAIDPNGTVKVPVGDSRTFTFYSKPWHRITAVYVDGIAITSAELSSGTYTFHNVLANHTISVVSEIDEGSEGYGGNGGTIGGGNGVNGVNGGNGGTIGGGNGGQWAVLNLVCAIIAVFTGLIAIIAGRDRFKKDNEEERSMTATAIRVSALLIGILSVVIFFLTEDWTLPVTAIDNWTPLMFVLLVAALAVAKFGFMLDMSYKEAKIWASGN